VSKNKQVTHCGSRVFHYDAHLLDTRDGEIHICHFTWPWPPAKGMLHYYWTDGNAADDYNRRVFIGEIPDDGTDNIAQYANDPEYIKCIKLVLEDGTEELIDEMHSLST